MAAFSSIAALALVAAGGIVQANAQKRQGEYQEQLYNYNASVADIQEQDAIERGKSDALAYKRDMRRRQGTITASLAAQGLDLESGSALDVQQDFAGMSALDLLTIENNAAREAWGYKVQSGSLRSQGAMAKKAGRDQAFGTLLTTGAQAYYVGTKGGGWGKTTADPRFGVQSGRTQGGW